MISKAIKHKGKKEKDPCRQIKAWKPKKCRELTIEDRDKIIKISDPENFPRTRYASPPDTTKPIEVETDCSHFTNEIYRRAGIVFPYVPTSLMRCLEYFKEEEIEVKIEKNGKGIPIKESSYITPAWQRTGFLDVESDDDPYSNKYYMYFSLTPFGGDEPNLNRKGLEGLTCLVDINDFIKNPFGKINLKRLCEGENKNKIEQAKKELLRIVSILKKAQSSSLLKENK